MVTENEKVVIWLTIANILSYKKMKSLLNIYEQPKELWYNFTLSNNKVAEIIKEEEFNKLNFLKDDNYLKNYVNNLKNQNIEIITLYSDNYPNTLKEIDAPPFVMYCKGDTNLLNSKCLAIVGTRRPTHYGKDVTYKFAYDIAKCGVTIVSGLSYGVDSEAHSATLDAKGKTIAVLGGGFNHIYPSANIPLVHKILDNGGLLISEYQPNEKPQKYRFPERNRIIAGLSQGVLIPEASEKSGSMHTKNFALEYNRNLFVVPGRITDVNSLGCNKIIKNLQASMVLEPNDILETYGLTKQKTNETVIQLDLNDEIVLSLLDSADEVHYEELLAKSNLEPKQLNTTLIRLELKGLIKKLASNYYCK